MSTQFALVNSILHCAYKKKDDSDLTPLRIQALLYLVHGWYLAIENKALLSEPFIATRYGPLLPDVQVQLSVHGNEPVDDYILEYDAARGKLAPLFININAFPQFQAVLAQVWKVYRPLTTTQLRSLAQGPGSPWEQTAPSAAIDNGRIREAFVQMAWQNQQNQEKAYVR